MRTALAASCLALGLFLSAPQALAQNPAADKQQIEAIVEAFRVAIIEKDIDSFMKLFLHEDITWSGVMSDGSLARINAEIKDPNAPRPMKYFNGKPRKFIEGIAKSPSRKEETFDSVHIDSDGDVAQVWFDYTFVEDGHKNNWGKESWQMVRTASGWKIAAVIWSMEDNPVPPPAKKK
ncbi:YybH family protein [Massilia oculi]|uniref:YybH family protein n=1 Tax=Massilia oculi TaxID=945844 RepID=UPI0028B0AA31|nr:nuclear transport factor 2 family protein [Massilia oculi]